ncbi:MAG TPA: hypothetical protein EYO33_03175 [Phycisphaerales bacterium]|nr:hypothetical protein [Phycisphaerales bacterium]
MDQFVEQQKDVGSTDSTGTFTLNPVRAREKMRQFQLALAGSYIGKVVQAATRTGAAHIEVKVTRDALTVSFTSANQELLDLDSLLEVLLSVHSHPDSAIRHLAVGLNAAANAGAKEVRWCTPGGSILLTDTEIRKTEDVSKDLRFVVRKNRSLFTWFRGTVYLEETEFLRERCLFGPCPVTLDGRQLKPEKRWDSFAPSDIDHFGLGKLTQKFHVLEVLEEAGSAPSVCAYPPRAAEFRLLQDPASEEERPLYVWQAKSSQSPALPLLYSGATSDERPLCLNRALSFRPTLHGTGYLALLKDGVLLEPIEVDLGHPGAVLMTGAGDLKTDLSEFGVVEDDLFLDFLLDQRPWVGRQSEWVTSEHLEAALQACGLEPKDYEKRLSHYVYWLHNHRLPIVSSISDLVIQHFPDRGFVKHPSEEHSLLPRLRKIHHDHLPKDEPILGFYDDTLMGSGKSGFLITPKRLCWKNTMFPPQYILWQNLLLDDLDFPPKKVAFMRTEISISLNDSVLDCLPIFLLDVDRLNLPPAYKLSTGQGQILHLAYQSMGIQDGVYFYPHIPRAKLSAAEEFYCGALPDSERPLLLYDDTFFGGADTGFLLTEKNLYWRNMFAQSKSSSLERLSRLEVTETSGGIKVGEDEISVYLSALRPLVKIFLEELLKSRVSQELS